MLPQLTVYAKILYLLMVVIAGAHSTTLDVQLQSACTNKFVRIESDGRVIANDQSDCPQNLTISSDSISIGNLTAAGDFRLPLTLYAKQSKMYLCFNKRWRLVGSKKHRGDMCQFYDTMVNGYIQYRSVVDESKFIGFTKNGKPIRFHPMPAKLDENCFRFFKWNLTSPFSASCDRASPSNPLGKVPAGHGISLPSSSPASTLLSSSSSSSSLASIGDTRYVTLPNIQTAVVVPSSRRRLIGRHQHGGKHNSHNGAIIGGVAGRGSSTIRHTRHHSVHPPLAVTATAAAAVAAHHRRHHLHNLHKEQAHAIRYEMRNDSEYANDANAKVNAVMRGSAAAPLEYSAGPGNRRTIAGKKATAAAAAAAAAAATAAIFVPAKMRHHGPKHAAAMRKRLLEAAERNSKLSYDR